jgi:hypothetical protein
MTASRVRAIGTLLGVANGGLDPIGVAVADDEASSLAKE